jgi:hypothetical protein
LVLLVKDQSALLILFDEIRRKARKRRVKNPRKGQMSGKGYKDDRTLLF